MALKNMFGSGYISIDIGFRFLKIVQVKKTRSGALNIMNFGIGDTPRDCIKNGAISNKTPIIKEISRVLKEHNINAKEGKIVMSGTNIITRIVMIDKVPPAELDKAIMQEIKDTIPIEMEKNRIDYKVLNTVTVNGKEKIKVFVTVVLKKIIDNYIEILEDLNLKPLAVDIPSNSVAKFFQLDIDVADSSSSDIRAAKPQNDTFIVIDLGSETTIINILKEKAPEFNRVILKGSSRIDNQIIKDMELKPDEFQKAELYKKTYGFNPNAVAGTEYICSQSAKKILDSILADIKMCIDFYITRCSGEHPGKIYLIGGGSQMKGVDEYFERALNLPTHRINVATIKGLEFNSHLDTSRLNFLVNALGTAM